MENDLRKGVADPVKAGGKVVSGGYSSGITGFVRSAA